MTDHRGSARIAVRWAAIYTAGLPEVVAAARRAELESDIWEQRHDRDNAAAGRIFSRLVRGAHADLMWRVETRYHLGGLMHGTAIVATRVAASIVTLIAAFVLLWGLTWTSPVIVAVGVVFAAICAALWWASTTPAARKRHRRLLIGGAVASTCSVAVVALAISGVSS